MRKQVIDKIKQYNIITIFGHIRPDGDCIGSQIGLKNILEDNLNKEVYVLGDSSKQVGFLGNIDSISDEKLKESLAVIVDTANKERISDQRYKEAKEIIKIDHHGVGSENYGSINLVEETASCCEILADMAIENNFVINKNAATALYTGIVTDTGGFSYKGTTSNTLEIASKLIKMGADLADIHKKISVETFNKLGLKGYVINNLKKTDKGFIYCYLSLNTVNEYNATREEASATIDVIANIKGCPVWALFIEDKDEIRIRLRSNGPRIDYLANKYEGGGHKFASGARIHKIEEIETFGKDVDELLEKYMKE